MKEKSLSIEERERSFEIEFVKAYLELGSVDKVFERAHYDLPISVPGAHRLIQRWGIVKGAGPTSILSEALTFMTLLLNARKPVVEEFYKSLPHEFQASLGTMHRIVHNIKEGIIRRVGTALVVTPFGNPDMILVGDDKAPRLDLGKPYGHVSLPMGYSKQGELVSDSIKRVLQQEVFTDHTVNMTFPSGIIHDRSTPFMYLDIADVRVAAYHIALPKNLSGIENFSSFKLENFRYIPLTEILYNDEIKYSFRAGVREIVEGYRNYNEKAAASLDYQPVTEKSNINVELRALAMEYSRHA
jgi:hypothetical protein